MAGSIHLIGHAADGRQRWQLKVYLGLDEFGRRRYRQRKLTGSKRDADRALSAFVAEIDQGLSEPSSVDDPTMDEMVARWIDFRSSGWAAGTAEKNRRRWELHGRMLGGVRVSRVTGSLLVKAYDERMKGGLGVATVHRVHSIVRAALADAAAWGLIAHNPAAGLRMPKQPSAPVDMPDPEAVRHAIEVMWAKWPEWATWVELAIVTGARRSEICALRWKDLSDGVLNIHRQIHIRASQIEFSTTKTGRSRLLALDSDTIALLARHRERQAVMLAGLGRQQKDDDPIFGRIYRGRWSYWRPDGVTHWWSKHRDALGLPGTTPKTFRHYAATHLLASGVSVKDAQGHLGHAAASMTLDRYGHAVPVGNVPAQAMRAILGVQRPQEETGAAAER